MSEQLSMRERLGAYSAAVMLGLTVIRGVEAGPVLETQSPIEKTLEESLKWLKQQQQQFMMQTIGEVCLVTNTTADCDVDGIINVVDKYPYISDPIDVDKDGILNFSDAQPYTSNKKPAVVSAVTPYNKIMTDSILLSLAMRQSKLTADSDKDKVPDFLDRYYGDDYGDSDRDGLINADDPAPKDPDIDNDGSLDGYDKAPNNVNIGKLADKRTEERRQQDKLQEKALEEKRQENKRLQQKADLQRQEEKRLLQKQQQRMQEEKRLRERNR